MSPPALAPLVEVGGSGRNANWYLRVFDPGQHLRTAGEVEALCARHESLAQERLGHALPHRIHGINNRPFGLTAIGALLHLIAQP